MIAQLYQLRAVCTALALAALVFTATTAQAAHHEEGEGGLKVGKKAPAFNLSNEKDEKVSLKSLKGKWVVLYFYPKDDTPGCTTQACGLRDDHAAFNKLDAIVLGCSPDSPESHRAFIAKYDLNFSLLSDPSKKMMKKYQAIGMRERRGKKVEGVIRSTLIISPDGKVAHHWPQVSPAGHSKMVADKLKELQG
ncbi:MAG: peroxiredoxin [Planctomycetota bacterium]|jgi:peroxiredoxin Q/BCP